MTKKKRIAVIDYDKCNYQKCGMYLCEKVCPVNRNDKECIIHNEGEKPTINEEVCIGCEICQNKCPFDAISIVNVSFDLDNPIHSYGKNSFRLHGLPLPKENKTIGLIGRNGIGKTTILNILLGAIIPNLGEKKGDKEKVLEYFKGKEAQAFFEKVYSEGITIAIKPQNIEGMKIKGKVKDLLKKVDERNKLEEIIEELGMEKLIERDASKLSGGEFQKLAIAATGLKEADVYFFDEPTSFLDIRERLRVARFIRKLSEEKASLVIEHDMILLDYLSDFVHLIYGKPQVYGIVSQIKTTREGINDYLEGYSREENYRFRDYKIDFFSNIKTDNSNKEEKTVSWPKLEKKLGEFKLEVEKNSINLNEVVGIVGPNGIGKTTFMKMLAKEIKPDNTEMKEKAKISYKPQYISYTGNKTVRELFETDIDKIKNTIIKPLEINTLLEKKAKTLSGGELQRVSIALCLSKEADLYLLDEPSAYLDVEQRLIVGKTIRNHISVNKCSSIIIDHDLTFIDYVSDKISVFEGEPSIQGKASGPFSVDEGMNKLLNYLGITVRRDAETKRPRINKLDSVLDREQKQSGKYYE
jgi:ATP-binding cassette, sub-family E, member 1